MKFLWVVLSFFLAYSSIASANQDDFAKQYITPLTIKIFSNDKGVVKEEPLRCTPQTCCFSERSYCYIENGKCICDLHVCGDWFDAKDYWMEMTGAEAEKYCGRARFLHDLTQLCVCDPNKIPPCDECNPPTKGWGPHPREGLSLPRDCRIY